MSIIDKTLAAITPLPSDESRAEANHKARDAAEPGDWLSLVLDHHDLIREAFAAGRNASFATERTAAMRPLALVLNGHSLAEELVLYPALDQAGEKVHARPGLPRADDRQGPDGGTGDDRAVQAPWLDKWGHIEGAVLTPIVEEESTWFLDLKAKGEDQKKLRARYAEEYDRYTA